MDKKGRRNKEGNSSKCYAYLSQLLLELGLLLHDVPVHETPSAHLPLHHVSEVDAGTTRLGQPYLVPQLLILSAVAGVSAVHPVSCNIHREDNINTFYTISLGVKKQNSTFLSKH